MSSADKNIYDDLDVGDAPKSTGIKIGGGSPFKIIAIALIVLLLAGIIFVILFAGSKSRISAAKTLPLAESGADVNAVKSFAASFLDKFYWYNMDTFQDVRAECEKMTTTNFLEKFKRIYYDNEFESDIIAGNLIISTTYDAIMYKKDVSGTYARVLGDIKYTNGRTGASTKRVATWTLKIVNQDGLLLVDDFIIEIGRK